MMAKFKVFRVEISGSFRSNSTSKDPSLTSSSSTLIDGFSPLILWNEFFGRFFFFLPFSLAREIVAVSSIQMSRTVLQLLTLTVLLFDANAGKKGHKFLPQKETTFFLYNLAKNARVEGARGSFKTLSA